MFCFSAACIQILFTEHSYSHPEADLNTVVHKHSVPSSGTIIHLSDPSKTTSASQSHLDIVVVLIRPEISPFGAVGFTFSVKGQIVNIFGFACCIVSVRTTQPFCWSAKPAIDNDEFCDFIPIKLYLQNRHQARLASLTVVCQSLP